jgi:hypothetical protein
MKVWRLKLPAPVLVRSSGYYLVYTASKKDAEADIKSWMERFPQWKREHFDLESIILETKSDVVGELNNAITDAMKRGPVGM